MRKIQGEEIHGIDVDSQTRCDHYHSELDIVAIKFKCCGRWYSCIECHTALADHAEAVWPAGGFGERAVFCGACGYQLTINEYLASGSDCPSCGGRFNPGCRNHYHLYFEK